MPRKATQQEPDFDKSLDELKTDDAIDLIRWVARVIVVRNANGRRSDQFCRCCQQSRLLKEPCRHAEVWKIAGIRPE